ncbi:hypothetical protein B9Z65_1550 [Elsinoe australis]|uniref:NAD-dependent epimerase/dehydratase domain-containing protein n=1 Tax=Elsinoe australis TaxID=40998 RepID=A0A2P7YG86_9PEZI|nr:hypothetical protein B9Z65_1550 [Elsinoe australis]
MRVLITGAAGFIGQILTRKLLENDNNELVLTDTVATFGLDSPDYQNRVKFIQADLITDAHALLDQRLDSVVLLHGIMSSGAEADLELGYRVNVDATRTLLFGLAKKHPGVRVIYASSEAVYGTPVPKTGVTERDITTPEMSYGCQKLICETLMNDLTRRGLINGFVLRLPTISVRPGKPTVAVTSFLSGIIREPMNGEKCILPLSERSWRHWMCSPRTLVHNLDLALSLPRDALPPHRRAVNLPGFAVTIQDMLDALEAVGGKDKLDLVQEQPIPALQPLLHSWADDFDNSLALSLGMKQDTSFVQSVKDFRETMAPA